MTFGEWYIRERERIFINGVFNPDYKFENAPKKMKYNELVAYYNSKLDKYWKKKGMR